MDDDFDLFGDADPDPDDAPGRPTYRATIVGERITVIHWVPFLASGPLHRPILREREQAGVTIADLTVLGDGPDRELVVKFLARGGGEAAGRALSRWAAQTGHRRIWFPGRVVDLKVPARFGQVATTCSNCGFTYHEDEPEFWATVRSNGTFPTYCLVCGGDLPQWTGRSKQSAARSGATAPRDPSLRP
jgi:hypothetical protein